MSKLETNTIDTISGSTNLTLGGTNATDITIPSGVTVAGFKSTGIDDNATSTAITIDSSGHLLVGSSSSAGGINGSALQVQGSGSTDSNIGIMNSINQLAGRFHLNSSGSNSVSIGADPDDVASGSSLRFEVDGGEAMRVTNGLEVLVGTTDTTPGNGASDKGVAIHNEGISYFARLGGTVMVVCRNTNDGNLVEFNQAGTQEGTISVSGSTVSYNGFTGTHWSRFTDNSKPTILRGTVLETLDEMCDWYNLEFDVVTQDEDGNDVTNTKKVPHVLQDGQSVGDVITYNHEGTDVQATIVKEADIKHMKSKVSDTVDAKNVYGVFVAYDEDGEGYNDFYAASVGSFVVRIKANETIAKGDLLQSNGDGTAKVQTDDNVKSSSFAKVLSTTVIETYDDGSFIVPCSLMC